MKLKTCDSIRVVPEYASHIAYSSLQKDTQLLKSTDSLTWNAKNV